jgi:hypothetical protein
VPYSHLMIAYINSLFLLAVVMDPMAPMELQQETCSLLSMMRILICSLHYSWT